MNGTTVITGKENIRNARMLTLRAMLKLECLGMKRHGQSAYTIIKQDLGLKGNKASVYSQLNAMMVEMGFSNSPL